MLKSVFATCALGALLLSVSVNAATTTNRYDPSCDCKKSKVGSIEKCLTNVRGSACVTSVTQDGQGGPVTDVTIMPRRGGEAFYITNIVINDTDVQPLLGLIFCPQCCLQTSTKLDPCTSVTAAKVVELQFDVVFKCPCKSEPTVVLTLEDSAGSLGTQTALLNSLSTVVNNVTPSGFTVNIFFSAYGLTNGDINNLIAGVLNPVNQPCINFIAQCK